MTSMMRWLATPLIAACMLCCVLFPRAAEGFSFPNEHGDHPAGAAAACPQGRQRVQSAKPITSNGCGSGGLAIKGDFDFTPCCDLHDACYDTCGAAQPQCETLFKGCMVRFCDQHAKGKGSECQNSASMYAAGSGMFGGGAFTAAQRTACSCAASSEVLPRYLSHFERIYQAAHDQRRSMRAAAANNVGSTPATADFSVAERMANVERLLHDPRYAGGNEWKLLQQALQKYPEAIEGSAANKELLRQRKKDEL